MEKIKKLLEEIGFSKNESEVYTVLVRSGKSSVLDISKRTKIHRSNIYDVLRTLISKGLVYEINDQTKLFAARELGSLKHYLKHKLLELEQYATEYDFRARVGESKIKLSKGRFALREALYQFLEVEGKICVYGIPKEAPDIIGPILRDFHKERIKKKMLMQHIYNSNAADRARYLNKMPYTEARVLPEKYDSFATTCLSGNKVTIFLWKPEIEVIEIEDDHLSLPYQNYFNILWSKAKKV